jgi:hypothetical protein
MLELHICFETVQKMAKIVDAHLDGNTVNDELAGVLHRAIGVAGPYTEIVTKMWSAVSDHNFELYRNSIRAM